MTRWGRRPSCSASLRTSAYYLPTFAFGSPFTVVIGLCYELFSDYEWAPGDPPDADAEYEPEETLLALEEAVAKLGHTTVRIGSARQLLRRLDSLRIDAALNIAEGARSRNREAYVPVLLELAGVPCLGSDALTLSLSLDKAVSKDLASAVGVPTPEYLLISRIEALDTLQLPAPFPLFVKPRYEGSSKGITVRSRVEAMEALRMQVSEVILRYQQDALVERFVHGGGEFTATIVGNDPPRVMPILQRALERESRIGLHALEHRGAPEQAFEYELGATLTPELEEILRRYALRIYEKLECRDFARVDFRTDEDGKPWFLEINPLPTFAPDGTFGVLAELAGRELPDLLAEVLSHGIRRIRGQPVQ